MSPFYSANTIVRAGASSPLGAGPTVTVASSGGLAATGTLDTMAMFTGATTIGNSIPAMTTNGVDTWSFPETTQVIFAGNNPFGASFPGVVIGDPAQAMGFAQVGLTNTLSVVRGGANFEIVRFSFESGRGQFWMPTDAAEIFLGVSKDTGFGRSGISQFAFFDHSGGSNPSTLRVSGTSPGGQPGSIYMTLGHNGTDGTVDTAPSAGRIVLGGNASRIVMQMGQGAGQAPLIGTANIQTSAAGIGNGADLTDDTLFTYSLPLNSLMINGESIRVRAWGQISANNNQKDVKLWFAGVAVIDSGLIVLNNYTFTSEYEITRIDATHVSVVASLFFSKIGVALTTQFANVIPNQVVADLSLNASIIKITGASGSSAANDILGYGMRTDFGN